MPIAGVYPGVVCCMLVVHPMSATDQTVTETLLVVFLSTAGSELCSTIGGQSELVAMWGSKDS